MKQGNIKRIERTSYLLEMGIDFQANDLETTVGDLKSLSKKWEKSFYEQNYSLGKITWIGYFDKTTQTVQIHIEKELFI